jgi:hypothetical protein
MIDEPISVAPDVLTRLKQALILEAELVTLARVAPMEALAEPQGTFRIRASLPVPRLMDPETAELRLLDIRLRRREGGWLVYQVGGLGDE